MMGREYDKQAQFTPDHLGTKPVAYKRNKGKKMHNKSNEQPDVIQTKGE